MVSDEEFEELKKIVMQLKRRVRELSEVVGSTAMRKEMFHRREGTQTVRRGSKRDTTKYSFNGKTYNKRGLVYAVIYFLATQHKIDSGEELRKMFPDKIQGSLGVIRRIESARQYTNAEKRYYLKPAEMLTFCDGQYAVCCQWDKHNIERFIKRANQYGCTIFYIEEEDF